MKAETIQIEQERTVAEMLASKGLDAKNFFVSLNGQVAKQTDVLRSTDEVKVIPAVAGG